MQNDLTCYVKKFKKKFKTYLFFIQYERYEATSDVWNIFLIFSHNYKVCIRLV